MQMHVISSSANTKMENYHSIEHKPIFIMSLDVELLWGFRNGNALSRKSLLMKNGGIGLRKCIDSLLDTLQMYRIPATWAIVGRLFLDHPLKDEDICCGMRVPEQCRCNPHPDSQISRDSLYYGKDIIQKIRSCSMKHEIGYHSFSHVLFSECSREVAEFEIGIAAKLGEEFGVELKSFIFPQHKIGHLDVLKRHGFIGFRGKYPSRYELTDALPIRKFKEAVDKLVVPLNQVRYIDGLWEIPCNLLFSDPEIRWTLLPRAKLGLERAIRSKRVFHIFLHPWDLLEHSYLLKDLERFLRYVSERRDEGAIRVMTMRDLAEDLEGTAQKTSFCLCSN